MSEQGDSNWPANVPRSINFVDLDAVNGSGQVILYPAQMLGFVNKKDGPRVIICADCGKPVNDGRVFHVKPGTFAIRYLGEIYYMERHIGVDCGCAQLKGLFLEQRCDCCHKAFASLHRAEFGEGRVVKNLCDECLKAPAPRRAVMKFAYLMERRLLENDYKGGWGRENIGMLLSRALDELGEFTRALFGFQRKGETRSRAVAMREEGADTANFIMMAVDVSDNIHTEQFREAERDKAIKADVEKQLAKLTPEQRASLGRGFDDERNVR